MRHLQAALLVLLPLVSACDDDTTTTSTTQDLSVAIDMRGNADLAGADLASVAPDSCNALLTCGDQCTGANFSTCASQCLANATATAQTYFGTLQACIKAMCNNSDGGATPCADPTSSACKSCRMSNCASQLAACRTH
jgi:hypothetical protein